MPPARRSRPCHLVRSRLVGRRPVQGGVLLQDPTFEVAELGARLDPELIDERPTSIAICPKRVGLAAGPIQRQHELLVEPLAQRHPLDAVGQVADRFAVTAEPQQQVDAPFRRRPPQFLEPGDLATGEVHAGDVLERFTSPQRQRIVGLVQRLAQSRPAGEGRRARTAFTAVSNRWASTCSGSTSRA